MGPSALVTFSPSMLRCLLKRRTVLSLGKPRSQWLPCLENLTPSLLVTHWRCQTHWFSWTRRATLMGIDIAVPAPVCPSADALRALNLPGTRWIRPLNLPGARGIKTSKNLIPARNVALPCSQSQQQRHRRKRKKKEGMLQGIMLSHRQIRLCIFVTFALCLRCGLSTYTRPWYVLCILCLMCR